jgi:hypothetical protein
MIGGEFVRYIGEVLGVSVSTTGAWIVGSVMSRDTCIVTAPVQAGCLRSSVNAAQCMPKSRYSVNRF